MAGWLVQGVRGEGKSLYAVHRIQEYLNKGCMVATNLDLFLDHLVDEDNDSIAYRLPDKPRIEDFESLPNAYDINYKDEDKNGLIVLDELALWFNSRTWKDKGRQEIVNWLLLSRKRHWDLILLVQDHEMIDKQVKSTLCDYLVQASRTDRQKIPYFSKILDFFFINSYMPKIHIYDVYYGFSGTDSPVETVKVLGHDIYDGYDTNQLFGDGIELLGTNLVDMRAISTYLPACYLSGQYYISKHEVIISDHQNEIQTIIEQKGGLMAKRRNATSGDGVGKLKLVFLVLALLGWFAWNFFFKSSEPEVNLDLSNSVSSSLLKPKTIKQFSAGKDIGHEKKEVPLSNSLVSFIDRLVNEYRPRLVGLATSPTTIAGIIEFWSGNTIVERFSIKELHALGFAVIPKPYGVNLVTAGSIYPVTSWLKPVEELVEDLHTDEE
jgi:hypothetical protein